MANEIGHEIADALGELLKRGFRATVYEALTENLGEGIDEVTYPVLSGLARTGPRSAADLAADVGLDRSGVSRRASRLEQAGLVRREQDPADGRAVLLTLTEQGTHTVAVMRQRLAAQIEASLRSWPKEEARSFARNLRRFIDDGPFVES
ncbi:MarR family winged helix-turn-helix transcriptional regulator [Amycolatopsis sp. NPDC059021]|uniref:MarR family winged helix-turn-helix transcriptional regulator n=1 Tax=Amycolatopsis sp. NPDC059021 TaxID=3346704 RepID=UPI0036715F89